MLKKYMNFYAFIYSKHENTIMLVVTFQTKSNKSHKFNLFNCESILVLTISK